MHIYIIIKKKIEKRNEMKVFFSFSFLLSKVELKKKKSPSHSILDNSSNWLKIQLEKKENIILINKKKSQMKKCFKIK